MVRVKVVEHVQVTEWSRRASDCRRLDPNSLSGRGFESFFQALVKLVITVFDLVITFCILSNFFTEINLQYINLYSISRAAVLKLYFYKKTIK